MRIERFKICSDYGISSYINIRQISALHDSFYERNERRNPCVNGGNEVFIARYVGVTRYSDYCFTIENKWAAGITLQSCDRLTFS